jgi:hypothetical protein
MVASGAEGRKFIMGGADEDKYDHPRHRNPSS